MPELFNLKSKRYSQLTLIFVHGSGFNLKEHYLYPMSEYRSLSLFLKQKI